MEEALGTRRWQLPLALFLVFQGLYLLSASGRVERMPDEFEVYLQVESLVDRGSLAIPQVPEASFYGKTGVDGEQYAPFGPASAFLVLPHHLAGRALAWLVGVSHSDVPAWVELVAAVTSLASTTWAALAVLGFFFAARELGGDERRAALAAGLLGGATLLWPYATFFYSEPQSAALLIWAVAFHLRRQRVPAGVATFALVLVKASNVIVLPGLGLLALGARSGWSFDRERLRALALRLLPFVLGGLLAGLVHLAVNTARFGDPMDFGYSWENVLRAGEKPRRFVASELPRGLFGLLLSPGKSLLLFAPPLLLALGRARAFWREHPDHALGWVAFAVVPLLFFGSFSYWEGGYCFGPRHLVPFVPVLLLPLMAGPPPGGRPLLFCAAVGVGIQLLGVSVSFMEDQALPPGRTFDDWESPYYTWHDPDDPAIPRGRPLNRYRLDYTPLRGYPVLLVRHLSSGAPGSGRTGLELLPLTLSRARATRGAGGIPPWLPWLLWLSSALPLGLGAWLGTRSEPTVKAA